MNNKKHLTAGLHCLPQGNVYVMKHSFFSDVVRIGSTAENPDGYARSLSAKTIGEYSVAFSLQCNDPDKLEKQIHHYLHEKKYTKEFYQVPCEVAIKLLKREILRIPHLIYL